MNENRMAYNAAITASASIASTCSGALTGEYILLIGLMQAVVFGVLAALANTN